MINGKRDEIGGDEDGYFADKRIFQKKHIPGRRNGRTADS